MMDQQSNAFMFDAVFTSDSDGPEEAEDRDLHAFHKGF